MVTGQRHQPDRQRNQKRQPGELEKHKAQPIIVVCANGTASREPAENLSKAGFEKVTMLKDGISGWSGENLPLVRGK